VALFATEPTVGLEARLTSKAPGLGELFGDVVTSAEVDLVRRLPMERRVWHLGVVFGHVERDEPLKGREAVELIDVDPVGFQTASPTLYHRIGEGHLHLGKHALQLAQVEQIIDFPVDVLNARVGVQGRGAVQLSISLMMVTSMCSNSPGLLARMPSFGLAG
jgi:hypothetical protein